MKEAFDYKALGERIRKARKHMNLTQEQLAEACDLSTAHIGHIERGSRALSIESLITISTVLGVSTDYLLLDVLNSGDRNISAIFNSISGIDESKYKQLYTITKILVENIDKL